jgi:hypothetical protein
VLVSDNEEVRPALKKEGLLTRDPRAWWNASEISSSLNSSSGKR